MPDDREDRVGWFQKIMDELRYPEPADEMAYHRQIQGTHNSVTAQQLQQLQAQAASKPRPHVVIAEDAHLTEDGIVLEVDPTLRVKIPAKLLRRLETLLTMAALARLLPPDTDST